MRKYILYIHTVLNTHRYIYEAIWVSISKRAYNHFYMHSFITYIYTHTYSNYTGVAVVDMGISALFLLLHTAWGLTADLYVKKGGTYTDKTLMKSMI